MNINMKGRNVEVTDAIREYVEKRLAKFDKMIGGAEEAYVTLLVQKDTHRVEVTIPLDGGVILRGEEQGNNMYACVDEVVEKLEGQIRKHKTRLAKRIREGSEAKKAILALEATPDERELVRTKHFPTKPMSLEEAIMQMDLLGHKFFVFTNEADQKVNVVYQRNDGNYGLLTPED